MKTNLPTTDAAAPAEHVWNDLLRTTELFRELIAAGMDKTPNLNRVTLNQARIFAYLVRARDEGRPVRLKTLARELDVSPAAASQAVERLVAYGVLDRSPDPDDRRAVRITFSPKGDQLYHAHERQVHALFESLDGRFDPGDFAAFRRVLARLADILAERWDAYLRDKHGPLPPPSSRKLTQTV